MVKRGAVLKDQQAQQPVKSARLHTVKRTPVPQVECVKCTPVPQVSSQTLVDPIMPFQHGKRRKPGEDYVGSVGVPEAKGNRGTGPTVCSEED